MLIVHKFERVAFSSLFHNSLCLSLPPPPPSSLPLALLMSMFIYCIVVVSFSLRLKLSRITLKNEELSVRELQIHTKIIIPLICMTTVKEIYEKI